MDRTQSNATTLGQSGSDGDEGVLRIPQSSSITGASSSDCSMESYPSTEMRSVYSLAPADWAKIFCRVKLKLVNTSILINLFLTTYQTNKLSYCELNYHDQKIRRTLTQVIRKHWTTVSTLLSLISSIYRDLHHWRSNQRPHIAKPKLFN